MLVLKEEWGEHEKMLRAAHLAGSQQVRHLWFEGVSIAGRSKTDGLIAAYRLDDLAQRCGISRPKRDKFLGALVKARLFHDVDALEGCVSCQEMLEDQGVTVEPGDYVVHDFLDHNPSRRDKGPIGQLRQKRRNDLRRGSKAVKVEVFRRDRGLCRYCGHMPVDGAVSIPDALEFDHVDPACFEPNYGNFADNVVVSCRACNRRKSQRTPEEAGMPLWRAGTTAADITAGRAVAVASPSDLGPPETPADGPAIKPASRGGQGRVRAGSGTGQVRVASGSGPGRGRDGSGAAAPSSKTRKSARKARPP